MDTNSKDKLEKLTDRKLSIEERAALLVESFSGIEPNPGLVRILEEVSSEYNVIKEAYQDLSRSINSEVFTLLVQIQDRKTAAVKIDVELLAKEKEERKYCSIYAKIPPLSNLKNDQDYSYFLSKYQEGTKLSQEIAELNLKVVHLLDVQRGLDNAFAESMIEMDYLTRRLNETIKTFGYMKTPGAIENYKKNNCAYKDLQLMIDVKNREFKDILERISKLLPKGEAADIKKDRLEV